MINKALIIMAFFSNACKAQEVEVSVKKTLVTAYKTVTPDFETFDTSQFNKIKRKLTLANKAPDVDIKNIGPRMELQGAYTLQEFDSNDNLIRQTIRTDEFTRVTEYLDTIIALRKDYYANGNIRNKELDSWLGFSIGKGYLFDERGHLTKTIDYEEGYQFDFEKVLDFCRKNSISLMEPKMGGLKTTIMRVKDRDDHKAIWAIETPRYKKGQYDFYLLDGMTGELKKTGSMPLPTE